MPKLLYTVPKDVIVTTTINHDLQSISDTIIADFVKNIGKKKNFSQATFIALNNEGGILAMTGGASYGQTA